MQSCYSLTMRSRFSSLTQTKGSMNNLFFATSIALLNNKSIIINTNDYDHTFHAITSVISANTSMKVTQIDLLSLTDLNDLILQMSYIENVDTSARTLYNMIIWKHLNLCSEDFQRQLVRLFDEINQFDTNRSKFHPSDTLLINKTHLIRKPEFYSVIGLLSITKENFNTNMMQSLKEQFWFSQFHLVDPKQSLNMNLDQEYLSHFHDFESTVIAVRNTLEHIYQAPDITGYIYSLIVQIRNHRLMTLAPIQTRLPTKTIDLVSLLAKSIIAWQNRSKILKHQTLYITPVYCKIAIRKIGYWLVDWHIKDGIFDLTNETIANDLELENRRKLIINMLAGEWYGSEWEYVKEYLGEYYAAFDPTSNTGFSNKIIEDSIRAVKPPM